MRIKHWIRSSVAKIAAWCNCALSVGGAGTFGGEERRYYLLT